MLFFACESIIVSAPTTVETTVFTVEDRPGSRSVAAGVDADAGIVAACIVSLGATRFTIASKHDGRVKFECGTKNTHGLFHIVTRHPLPTWRNQAGGQGGSMVRYIDFAVHAAVSKPARTSYDAAKRTRCYTTPIEVRYLENGRVKTKTWNPTVYVSKNNKRIVTAIPTSKGRC